MRPNSVAIVSWSTLRCSFDYLLLENSLEFMEWHYGNMNPIIGYGTDTQIDNVITDSNVNE